MNNGKCRSCGAAIIWCPSQQGKLAPIDAESAVDGNIRILADGSYEVMTDIELMAWEGSKHKNYFATCPQSKQWKKT